MHTGRFGYVLDSRGRRWSSRRIAKARPTDYLRHFADVLPAERKRVVLYCRESTEGQRPHLQAAIDDALHQLAQLGCKPVATVAGVESGRICADRLILETAIECAREDEAILVVPSRCRLLRDRTYDGRNSSDAPCIGDVAILNRLLGGVTVASLLHPAMQARGHQIRRGQHSSGNYGGRPCVETHGVGFTKRRRRALLAQAQSLAARGLSYREITLELNKSRRWPEVSFKTVWNWLNAGV